MEELELQDEEEASTNPGSEPMNADEEDEADVDMQPRPDYGTKTIDSLEQGRVQLEMNWQINECEADKDYCSNTCRDCEGSGRIICRFCHGKGMIAFGTADFRPCIICSPSLSGFEECHTCQGTGQIAPWASTMENHMKGADGGETPEGYKLL